MLRLLLLCIGLFSLFQASPAMARSSRLILVEPDAELEAAVRATLRAWGTVVVVQRGQPPGSSMPGSAKSARKRAEAQAAQAVVWISESSDGFALWMYDAKSGRVISRPLATAPPFDEATAASLGLAIKTMLRHSEVPPVTERVQPPARAPRFFGGFQAGGRWAATRAARMELRLGARATLWPELAVGPLQLGFSLELESGTGVAVQELAFAGRWHESALLFGLPARLSLARRFDLTLVPALGVNMVSIDGVVSAWQREVSSTRFNGLGALSVELGFRPGPAHRLGLRWGLGVPSRTQSYFVFGEEVLRVRAPLLSGGLFFEAGVF